MSYIFVTSKYCSKSPEESCVIRRFDRKVGFLQKEKTLPYCLSPNLVFSDFRDVIGLRGICYDGKYLYVAGFDRIYVLSLELNVVHIFRSPLFLDIHKIYPYKECILIINTGNDTVYLWDKMTSLIPLYSFEKYFPYSTGLHANWGDHMHITALSESLDGYPYVLFANTGSIVDLQTGDMIFDDELFQGSHDLIQLKDLSWILINTRGNSLIRFKQVDNRLEIYDHRYFEVLWEKSRSKVDIGWMRGATYDAVHDTLFVGVSPGRLLVFEEATRKPNDQKAYKVLITSNSHLDSPFDLELVDL